MVVKLAERYGYRGLWLMLLGVTWCAFGVGVLFNPAEDRPWVLYEYLPVQVQAVGWWVTGALAVWQGARGTERDDIAGHVALYVMPAVRMLSFAFAWLIYVFAAVIGTDGLGYAQGWYPAIVWLLISLMLALGASWPNPQPPLPHPPAEAVEDA